MNKDDERFISEDIFLFGEPKGFFDAFKQLEPFDGPLQSSILTFKSNLSSAIVVGNVPFQLTHSGVLDQRFNQLHIAEKIRSRNTLLPGENNISQDEEDAAFKRAEEKMKDELKDPEIINMHSVQTLKLLDRHLETQDFQSSAQETLRQVLVICWSAFEVLISDTLRSLMNECPKIIGNFTDTKPYREALSGRALLEALENNNFDLSHGMGDLFCDLVKLDALEKIRAAILIALVDPKLDIQLKDERLWSISQQRHLIVHRRGVVDSHYLERTSDSMLSGDDIEFKSAYIEECLVVVRDVGCSILKSAQFRINNLDYG